MRILVTLLAALGLVATASSDAAAQAPTGSADPAATRTPLEVVLPDPDNLQYLSFWIALGAGFFEAEGFDVHLSHPSFPNGVLELFRKQGAPVAVLRPQYLQLVAESSPIKVVANLLRNDGINLIVRRPVFDERHLSASAPLADRLRGLKGVKVGVAPGPVTRLKILFESQGLSTTDLIETVVMPGQDENDAFAKGKVDALYAHTPYLEKALVDQGAVMLVNQSAGEVPRLSGLQIHTLVVTSAFAAEQPKSVTALVRAIHRAETLVHADRPAAARAVLRALPALEARLVEPLVAIYEPAVPVAPQVSAALFLPALELFPARKTPPSLDVTQLGAFVAPEFAEQVVRDAAAAPPAQAPRSRTRATLLAAALAGLALGLGVLVARRRRRTSPDKPS